MVNNHYFSPSYGTLTLDEVRSKTLKFIQEFPEYKYQMVIGTDSKPANGKGIDFVTAIVIHRQGVGGIYFWKRLVESKRQVWRHQDDAYRGSGHDQRFWFPGQNQTGGLCRLQCG